MQRLIWFVVASAIAILFVPGTSHTGMGDGAAVGLLMLGIGAALVCLLVLLCVARFISRRGA